MEVREEHPQKPQSWSVCKKKMELPMGGEIHSALGWARAQGMREWRQHFWKVGLRREQKISSNWRQVWCPGVFIFLFEDGGVVQHWSAGNVGMWIGNSWWRWSGHSRGTEVSVMKHKRGNWKKASPWEAEAGWSLAHKQGSLVRCWWWWWL